MPEGWNDFYVAVAGASAALAGLLFVALSINLTRILEFAQLPARAFESLAVLVSCLLVSLYALVPGQSALALGIELALTGCACWCVQTSVLLRHWKASHGGNAPLRVLLNQASSPPLVVGGVLLALHQPSGAYWLVPAVVLSFIAGLTGAWVMLVEIQR